MRTNLNNYLAMSVFLLGLAGSASAWTNEDVGTPTPGSASYNEATATWTVTGNGHDIWDTADNFHYVYKYLSGDGEIIARVASLGPGSNPWAKAGVMIRDTLDAGSRHAFVAITGGSGDGTTFQWRAHAYGISRSSRTLAGISPPASVKLVRRGDTFTGYIFLDGQWQQEGESATVAMTDPVYIGLAITSHVDGELRTATFDNVSLIGNIYEAITVSPAPAGWRSSLYPEDWTPGYKDAQGRFLHDFSYAGYHKGEVPIPINPPGLMVDVTLRPYGADNTGATDATDAIQAAIDTVGIAGGGIVYLPEGTYRLRPPSGSDYALHIWHSGVVLRGAGPGQTFLFNDETYMRNKSVILVGPSTGGWHSPLAGTSVYITQDVDYPTHIIPVAETALFNVGDWVVLRTDCTDSFIAEHGMTGQWNSSLKGITFYRKVTAVDPISNTITVDIPTRYYLQTRDNARVYKVRPHLEEIGIEFLSIGMRENLTGGLGDNDYSTSGTAAYEVHGSHFIELHHVVNSWMQDVETYHPPVNTNNWHTLSNIILVSQSRNVTVSNCVVARPEYEGGGGNGYGYTLRGSDCLIIDCTAFHTRHNYDFKSMWTSSNVIFRCETRDGRLPSDFHMHLSPANLFDSTYVDGDLLQAVYRPYGTILHGQTTTESVFWNTYGTERCGARLVVSRQWKWGYVIGTSGPVHNVELGTQYNSAPEDFLEGQGQGETLLPQSLYLDQLYRRRGMDLDFSGRVDFVDFNIFASYWMNGCDSPDWCYGFDFDRNGEVSFGDIAEFANDWLSKK